MPRIATREYTGLDSTSVSMIHRVADGSIITRFDKTPPPNEDSSVVCPHFMELKWAYGCPFDCAWCYLKGTFRFLPTKTRPVFKDRDKIALHTRAFLEEATTPEILNTGELADSLMGESAEEPFSRFIVPMFEAQARHKVLFLTKSDRIDNLLGMTSHDQTIVSFTLNAQEVADRWEKGAPPVERRIEAGRRLSEAGYEVRVRIDPIVPVPDSEEQYRRLIDELFASFVPERVTLGSLRGLQSTINNSPDRSWTAYLRESSNWGKKVDFGTRLAGYSTVIKQLKTTYHYEAIALCKETVAMWEALGMDYKKMGCNCIW